ncbi:MAG: hypothetical protein EGP82_01995 [Odoribacter splanchnicus]|nr:hypothetical protein [Odoribacter splanchnicus]
MIQKYKSDNSAERTSDLQCNVETFTITERQDNFKEEKLQCRYKFKVSRESAVTQCVLSYIPEYLNLALPQKNLA